MEKCFGIVSWLPNDEPARQQRKDRINRLFKQLNNFWPEIDIIIIAQNWKDFKPIKIKNKINKTSFDNGLGILKARQTLHKTFLKSKYDYIIMFDDDAIISGTKESAKKYMELVDNNPNGFCFIHSRDKVDVLKSKYNTYAAAQLNLCAISRNIMEKVPFFDIDPQRNEGYEDSIFASTLHTFYNEVEFLPPADIYCTQFLNKHETAPSTWARTLRVKQNLIGENTTRFIKYIVENKQLPNIKLFTKYGILVSEKLTENDRIVKNMIAQIEAAKSKQYADGRKTSAYLYF